MRDFFYSIVNIEVNGHPLTAVGLVERPAILVTNAQFILLNSLLYIIG